MAPTFALDLSLDGIRLLYRAEGGWTVVGDVSLEDPALGDRLAAFRAAADALAPGAIATELVIPASQIRYATIPRPTEGAVTAESLLPALEGLTPLSADELAFDWEVEDDAVRLALVDRLTLSEAETFAAAHRFNPVSFSARPTPAQFPRAPDFGPTAGATAAAPPAALLLTDVAPALASPIIGEAPDAPHPDAPPPDPAGAEAPAEDPAPDFATDVAEAGTEIGAATVAEVTPEPARTEVPQAEAESDAPREPVAVGAETLAQTLYAPLPVPPVPTPGATPPQAIGAAALAQTLSAPRQGHRPAPARRPALQKDRRLIAAGSAAIAAALALAVFLGRTADPAALLPDTPPEVALALPALQAPGASEPAAAAPAATDGALASSPVAAVPAPEPSSAPVADTTAPALLRDDVPGRLVATAPVLPAAPRTETTDSIYLASIDPVTRTSDAIALLPATAFAAATRPTLDALSAGAAPVVATAEGALTPDAVVVREGRPPLTPPAAPGRATAAAEPAAALALEPTALAAALPDTRPRTRPAGLVERNERATLGGRTRAELAALKPLARPASAQAEAVAAAAAPPSDYAVAVSRVPRDRPADLATRVATASAVAAALAAAPPPPAPAAPAPTPQVAAPQVAAAAPPPAAAEDYDDGEPEAVAAAPSIPTSASVARQATIQNAMSLREINLIGVYGTERDRRALVRLPSGRFVKVKVGDRLDGGQIAAIGRDELRYIKGGRNVTLEVPSG